MLLLFGGATPNPLSIVGGPVAAVLELWLDANSLNGQADASAVSSWTDLSGLGNTVTQATGGKQPSLVKNQIAGNSIVRFDGTADILVKATPTGFNSAGGDVFCVFKKTAATTQNLISSADEATSVTHYWIGMRVVTRTAQRLELDQRTNDTEDAITGGTTIGTSAFQLAETASSGTAYTIRLNGTAESLTVTSGADNGDWLADTPNRDSLTVGGSKWNAETQWFGGDMAEILVYNRALTTAERGALHQYFRSKYGLTIA